MLVMPGEQEGAAASTSVASGVTAAVVACLAALPVMGVTWVVASVMKLTLLRKVLHVSATHDELHDGTRIADFAKVVVAGTTGALGLFFATCIALYFFPRARRAAFLAVMTIVWAVGSLGFVAGNHDKFAAVVGVVMALAGIYLADVTMADPKTRQALARK